MALREELKQFSENAKKEMEQLYEKIKQHPLTCLICIIAIVTAVVLLIALPYWRVAQFGITDPKDLAEMENSYRTTLAQILGGIAVGIGIYFAWGNLTTAREGQITERFTRAVNQLGNEKMEIRLGGIYALERIANESKKDYWPIMEIMTTYVRENSPVINDDLEVEVTGNQNEATLNTKVKAEIQAILTVIGRRKHYSRETFGLDLHGTCLRKADLKVHFEGVNLQGAELQKANLIEAHFEKAFLNKAHLEGAELLDAHFEEAFLEKAHLEKAVLCGAHFEGAELLDAHFEEAFLEKAHLEGANLMNAHLEGAFLEEAHLEGAYLINTHLEGTHLEMAHLEGACINRADLIQARHKGAHLKGAIIDGVVHEEEDL